MKAITSIPSIHPPNCVKNRATGACGLPNIVATSEKIVMMNNPTVIVMSGKKRFFAGARDDLVLEGSFGGCREV